MLSKAIISTVILYAVVLLVESDEPSAQDKCRTIHHTDVDAVGTSYLNYKCKLICSIHDKLWPHNFSESESCPELIGTPKASTMMCRSGECVYKFKMGFIDVEIASADLTKTTNAFAVICIQNGTAPLPNTVELPVRDRTQCQWCKTDVKQSRHAVWSKVCAGSHLYKWTDQSRVIFEVWDQISAINQTFVGGSSVTITKLNSDDNSHKEIEYQLTGGVGGKLFTRVTWTPI